MDELPSSESSAPAAEDLWFVPRLRLYFAERTAGAAGAPTSVRVGRKGVRKARLATRVQQRASCTNLGARRIQFLAVGDHILDLRARDVQSFLIVFLVLVFG